MNIDECQRQLAPSFGLDRRSFLASATAGALGLSTVRTAGSQSQERWRVGIIGHTGRGNFGHGLHTMWLALPDAEIVGLADPDNAGRAKALEQLGNNSVVDFADYHEMLAVLKPQIVVVSPRHIDQHRDMAVAAAESGARGIYCEKPFCRTPAEADDIVNACAASNTKLAIAHRNRCHPAVPVAVQAVKDGIIGRLLEVRGRGLEDHRGGVQDLWVLGTHVFDMARAFVGEAISCSAELLGDNRPVTSADVVDGAEGLGPICGDRLHARYEMSTGIPLYFDSIRDAGVKAANFGLQLIGTEGIIDLRIDVEPLVHLVPGNPFRPTAQPRPWIPISSAGVGEPEPIEHIKSLVANHTFAARDLLAAIADDRPALSSAEDGRAIVDMIHAAFASHVAGSQRVTIPLLARTHALRAEFGR